LAYARTLSLLIVRAAGYRPRTVGGHYNTFLALEAADPAFAALFAYFDSVFLADGEMITDILALWR
jgi:hypothetical protein